MRYTGIGDEDGEQDDAHKIKSCCCLLLAGVIGWFVFVFVVVSVVMIIAFVK